MTNSVNIVNGVTLSDAGWGNDVDRATYDVVIDIWHYLSASEQADMGTASLDVSAAVATAIAAFGANGGVLLVPGYFGLGAAGIAITNKTGIVIEGRGPKAGFKCLTVSATGVATWGVSSIRMTGSTRCGLKNLFIDNNSLVQNAVAIYNNTECAFEGNTVINGAGNANLFAGGNFRNRYVGNVIKDSVVSSSCRGMWIGGGNGTEYETEALIHGNNINATDASGIAVLVIRSTVSDNICIDCDGAGIVVGGTVSNPSSASTFTGNVCKGNAFHGMQIGDGPCEYLTVTGNTCESNTFSGIALLGTNTNCVVSSNICKDNGDTGIGVAVAKYAAIIGNHCSDSRAGGSRTQNFGISIQATTAALDIEDALVNGNLCRNNTEYGVLVVTSGSGTVDTLAISNNMALDNSTNGISVNASSSILNLSVTGNTALGNTTLDLRVDPTDAIVADNKFVTGTGVTKGMVTGSVGNVGGGEDDMLTYALPANSLVSRGNAHVTAWGVTANNSNPKTVQLYIGSVSILSHALTVSQLSPWRIEADVCRSGASQQRVTAVCIQGGTATKVSCAVPNTLTQTDTADITIKCTATVTDGGGGINNDDIQQREMVVKLGD